jgi:hypothetical protein
VGSGVVLATFTVLVHVVVIVDSPAVTVVVVVVDILDEQQGH